MREFVEEGVGKHVHRHLLLCWEASHIHTQHQRDEDLPESRTDERRSDFLFFGTKPGGRKRLGYGRMKNDSVPSFDLVCATFFLSTP